MRITNITRRIRNSVTIDSRRRGRKCTPKIAIESMEPRVLLTQAAIDFDGEELTAEDTFEGGFFVGAKSADSFHSLFNGEFAHLDVNGNGTVNLQDAELAIDRIMDKVHMDYLPYAVNIFEGDQDDFQSMMTPLDSTDDGDVIVIVSGNTYDQMGFGIESLGIAPNVDLLNEQDNIVFVFGRGIAEMTDSPDQFINVMAKVVSHEMGHSFGLDHLTEVAEGYDLEVLSHELMAAPFVDLNNPNYDHDDVIIEQRDFDHDFAFQDITYINDSGVAQNSHQHLTNVLGASGWGWMAVLKPGELTMQGAANAGTIANDLSVTQVDGNTWQAQVVYQRRWPEGWFRTFSYTAFVDTSNPDIRSLNPFAQEMTDITIMGSDFADRISIDPDITVDAYIDGMDGNDDISGGGGNDMIMGGDGMDKILGNGGADWLDGGDDLFEDILDGGDDRFRDTFVTYYTTRYNSRTGKIEQTSLDTVYNRDWEERDRLISFETSPTKSRTEAELTETKPTETKSTEIKSI
ncbi:MAG: hypothetical protein KDA93_03930 [Planctomycetaceae bacterium]|nr:hypothetical protein [Planctomycetaceae bacterium]